MNIAVNGLVYLLDLNEFTAKVVNSYGAKGNILIPSAIYFESQEFHVTIIGYRSFMNNKDIRSILFEEDSELKIIEKDAFYYSSIESITLPKHVKIIGEWAFHLCYQLKTFKIPENSELYSIETGAFSLSTMKSIFIPCHITTIIENVFANSSLSTITFSEKSELTSIKHSAFANTNIQNISIPVHVKIIDDYAFSGCKNLQIINFSENSELTFIGEHAFKDAAINNLFIPSNVEEIKEYFCNSSVKKISISPKNKFFICFDNQMIIKKNQGIYDNLIFVNRNAQEIFIPSFIKIINKCAFFDCLNLRKVQFAENCKIEAIEYNCFSNTAIEEIKIPSSVTKIGKNAFHNCKKLKKVIFSDDSKLISIDYDAFCNTAIQFITFPRGIKTLNPGVLSECYHIKSVDFQEGSELQTIKMNSFFYSSIESIFIPSKVERIEPEWAFLNYRLKNINISPKNENFIFYNKNLLIGKTDINNDSFDVLITATNDIGSIFIVPSFIKKIQSYAFICCKYLKIIQFEKNTQICSIENNSFSFYSLRNLTIPIQTQLIPNFKKIGLSEFLETIEYLGDSFDEEICLPYCPKVFLISFPNAKQVYQLFRFWVSEYVSVFICANSKLIHQATKFV